MIPTNDKGRFEFQACPFLLCILVRQQKKPADQPAFFAFVVELFLEIAVVKSLESCSVTGLVLAHLMNSVVDGVEILGLCELCNA